MPEDDSQARSLITKQESVYTGGGILYLIAEDGSLQIVPNEINQLTFMLENMVDAEVFSTLSQHYWCPKMRNDITEWCKACLVCATRRVGNAIKPYLMPIPVSGPFDHIAVVALQLPKSSRGEPICSCVHGLSDEVA